MPLDAFYLNYSTSLKFGRCNHLPVVLTFYSYLFRIQFLRKLFAIGFLFKDC